MEIQNHTESYSMIYHDLPIKSAQIFIAASNKSPEAVIPTFPRVDVSNHVEQLQRGPNFNLQDEGHVGPAYHHRAAFIPFCLGESLAGWFLKDGHLKWMMIWG